jgi:heme exporter protein D
MMQWESLQAFLHMGGYAGYVWGSFGVTAVLMAAEVWLVRRRMAAIYEVNGDEA